MDENDPFIRRILEREKQQLFRCEQREKIRRAELFGDGMEDAGFDREASLASARDIASILRACFGEKEASRMTLDEFGIESAEMLIDRLRKKKKRGKGKTNK